jgi:hypothetical protein
MPAHYRPWGPLDWILKKLPGRLWGMLGSLSTEDRCVATFAELHPGARAGSRFLRILDPDMPVTEPFAERHDEMRAKLLEAGCPEDGIIDVPLLASIDSMRSELEAFLTQGGEHLILDISTMPKHWFFPLAKFLTRHPNVTTLLVTYASAASYGRALSSNPNPLRALPSFGSDDARLEHETAIVGIGFEPLGLDELYAQHTIQKVRYIFPFPPGPPGFHRNWAFVRTLERSIRNREADQDDRWHIDMYDCPAVFDALLRVTRDGTGTSVLAPYGPKTTSLAMCLFANAVDSAGLPQAPVYYAQPKRYAIDYSSGVRLRGGRPDIQAYCIRVDGRNLYEVR